MLREGERKPHALGRRLVGAPAWAVVLALAVAAGVALRLDQFSSQVLRHVVHQVLRHGAAGRFCLVPI